MTFRGKVAVMPCTGVGQVMSTMSRQAAYLVCEDLRPDDTVLLCLPALVKGVEEDLDMVEQCPVVVIEGCRDKCATHALWTRNGRPAAAVSVLDAIRDGGRVVRREHRRKLTEAEEVVVALVAERVAAEVDRLLAEMKAKKGAHE